MVEMSEKLKRMPRTVRVGIVAGGIAEFISIQQAINWCNTQAVPAPSAANPYTVQIYPGVYDEQIACAPYVNLNGVGSRERVVIYQNDADLLTWAANVELENFTARLGAISAFRNIFIGAAGPVVFRDINLEVVVPGAQTVYPWYFNAGIADATIERCHLNLTSTSNLCRIRISSAMTIRILDSDITFADGSLLYAYTGGTEIISRGNRWAGAAQLIDCGQVVDFTFDHDTILAEGNWSLISGSAIFRNCEIAGPVGPVGNGATVRLKNCSYRRINRTGSGNIVDESPQLQDAPWKVHKWNWMAALASMDVAVRGTPLDAGSGQVLLEVTDNVAGQEAVETNPEAAGSLGTEFTPARTPRFLDQIAVDSFDPHVTMFFGLRETLGDAIPDITVEECAGFDWNGANFRAISSDGGGVGVATNLTTPSVNVQHQLEVIVIGGVQVEFYVDGVLVATHATAAGRPSAVLDWQHLLATAGTGGGDLVQVTVRNGGVQECPS